MTKLHEDDRRLFAATIERLCGDYFSIERCRADRVECAASEWHAFAEQGLMGIGISPEYGGMGGGISDLAMVMGEIGRNLLPLPYLDTVILGGSLVGSLGTDEQKAALLPAIAEGRLRISFAHREADAGDAFDYVGTTFRDGVLNGQKIQVMDAALSGMLLVSARSEEGDLGLYLVDRQADRLDVQYYRLPDNRLAARITLTGVLATPLGANAAGALGAAWDIAAACAAAETVGAIAALNRDTLSYAKVRKQFGTTIGSFQVLQHRMVDMFIAEQVASAMVADALAALDDGAANAPMLVSAAKAQADRCGRMVGESAIQIHGGMGMTDECSVGHYLKRVLAIGSQFGTAGWHVARIAAAAI